jgi:N-acetylneuraminic acid mutarotase
LDLVPEDTTSFTKAGKMAGLTLSNLLALDVPLVLERSKISGRSQARRRIRATAGIYCAQDRLSSEAKMKVAFTRMCTLLLVSVALPADTWTIVAPLPDATWRPSAAVSGSNGLMYAIGGINGSGPPSTNEVFVYNPAWNTWSAAPPLVAGPRRNLAAAMDNLGRIYAIAGYTPEFPLATVERFDPALGYWQSLPALPDARQGLAAATGGDGRIYAIGGVPFNFQPTARVDAFDPAGGFWVQVASMGTPRSGFGSATGLDGHIYVMGGYGANAYLKSAEVYDPDSNTWSPIAAMQSVRFDLAAAAGPDGRIYAIGGYDGFGNVASVEAYDPKADTWTFVAPMKYEHAIRAAATGLDGRIYVFGGEVAYPPLGIVEAYAADILNSPVADLARESTRFRVKQQRAWHTTTHPPRR